MHNSSSPDGQSPVKMKKVKQEHIQASINVYLKRRQITDSEVRSKRECRYHHSIHEMALERAVNGEMGTESILTFSSISGDATACDQQFTRLKNFIQGAVEPYKTELLCLLYPMFVNVYLELLCNGHKTPAHKFYDRHVSLVVDEENSSRATFLKSLRSKESKSDVSTAKDIMEFRDHKYTLRLSKGALEYVMRHLKIDDNMILLQMFNQQLKIEVRDLEQNKLELWGDAVPPGQESGTENTTVDSKPIVDDEVAIQDLKEICRKVREGPQCLPSIYIYTTSFSSSSHANICSSVISHDSQMLSTACENSTIVLQKISTGHLLYQQHACNDPSKILLAADTIGLFLNSYHDNWKEEGKTDVRDVATLRAHSGAVYRTRFLPDCSHLLSCSFDKTVRLWDLKKLCNVVCYKGHNYPVYDIDISPYGNFFASASADTTARLWSFDRNYALRTFVGHGYDVDCVRFHPNSNYVGTAGDRTIRLWSVQDGKCVRVMHGHRSSIAALAFSPDGMLLASSGDDRRVKIWDLRTGSMLKEFCGHADTVCVLDFNQQSTLLASGGFDSCIRIWDTRKTELLRSTASGAEGHSYPDLRGAYPLKSTIITHLHFGTHNLLKVAGKSAS